MQPDQLASWVPSPPWGDTFKNLTISAHPKTACKKQTSKPAGPPADGPADGQAGDKRKFVYQGEMSSALISQFIADAGASAGTAVSDLRIIIIIIMIVIITSTTTSTSSRRGRSALRGRSRDGRAQQSGVTFVSLLFSAICYIRFQFPISAIICHNELPKRRAHQNDQEVSRSSRRSQP